MISVQTNGLHCKLRKFDRSAIAFEAISIDFTFPETIEFEDFSYPVCGISDEFLLELLNSGVAVTQNITFVISKQFGDLPFSKIYVTYLSEAGWRWCERSRTRQIDSLTPFHDPPSISFDLPDSIEVIESGAFAGPIVSVAFSENSKLREVNGFLCCRLTTVNLPNSVESIGSSGFFGCTWMESLTLGCGLRELHCFTSNPEKSDRELSLRSLLVPNSVEQINGLCFCPRLEFLSFAEPSQLRRIVGLNHLAVEEITIPDSVEEINGLNHCHHLIRLRFAPQARLRELKGLGYNDALLDVAIPDSVETLEGFQQCPRLQELRFGQGSRLREATGLNALNICEIRFPDSVESLNVLSYCDRLVRVEFGPNPSVRSIRGLDGAPSIAEFVIPDSMETVDILSGAGDLRAIRFGANPRLREFNGFSRTTIVELTIPDTIESIVGFNDCTLLRVLKFGANPRVLKLHGFNNAGLEILEVPDTLEELIGFNRTDRGGGPRSVHIGANSRLRILQGFKNTFVEQFMIPDTVEELDISHSYCRGITIPENFRVESVQMRCPMRTFVSVPENLVSRVRRWSSFHFAGRVISGTHRKG